MANRIIKIGKPRLGYTPFGYNKNTPMSFSINGASGSVMLRTQLGTRVMLRDAISGTVTFEQTLDDGVYVASDVAGSTWTVTVSGTSATVSPIGYRNVGGGISF